MDRFVQLHLLTSYPPANLNRDDLGRPKTAMMGGAMRLRISSQCLKRNWRTSELFKNALNGTSELALSDNFKNVLNEAEIDVPLPHIGVRTKDMGIAVHEMLEGNVADKKADEWAKAIAEQFGKLQSAKKGKARQAYQIEQLAHFSPGEVQAIDDLVQQLIRGEKTEVEDMLRKEHRAVDIAMFGRMLAAKSDLNCEAAVQVAHALSVHKVEVESDYFTAVDDLNLSPSDEGETDMGAAHIGENEFGAGLFYLYVCIDREDLKRNLKDDEALTRRALRALTEAAVKVTPSGKRNSHGHHTYAHYVLAERGNQQPRSLAVAFLKPVNGKGNWLEQAREALKATCGGMDEVYDPCAEARYELDCAARTGKLSHLLDFVAGQGQGNVDTGEQAGAGVSE